MTDKEQTKFKEAIRGSIEKHCEEVRKYLLSTLDGGKIVRVPVMTVFISPYEEERNKIGDKHVSLFVQLPFLNLPNVKKEVLSRLEKYFSEDSLVTRNDRDLSEINSSATTSNPVGDITLKHE